MNPIVLAFVNFSREPAQIFILHADGRSQFIAELAVGTGVRQASTVGQKWSIVTSDTYTILVGDKNRAYIIGIQGVYEVETAHSLTAESGTRPADFDFPGQGGMGWP